MLNALKCLGKDIKRWHFLVCTNPCIQILKCISNHTFFPFSHWGAHTIGTMWGKCTLTPASLAYPCHDHDFWVKMLGWVDVQDSDWGDFRCQPATDTSCSYQTKFDSSVWAQKCTTSLSLPGPIYSIKLINYTWWNSCCLNCRCAIR